MDDTSEKSPAPDAPNGRVGLEVAIERVDTGTVCVRVAGELDLATGPELERKLDDVIIDGERTSIVLNLRDLSFLDSTGLRSLWTARQHALSTGGTLVLDEPSDPVLRILRMTKLDKIFHMRWNGDGAGVLSERPAAEPISPSSAPAGDEELSDVVLGHRSREV